MRIPLIGGLRYIGSHRGVALIDPGHEVIIVDNLIDPNRSHY